MTSVFMFSHGRYRRTKSSSSSRRRRRIGERLTCSSNSSTRYVGSSRTVGRCLKYLVFDTGEMVGTIWIGSAFKPMPKDILRWLGWSQSEMDANFNRVADNKRFCLDASRRNYGSQVLRRLRERVRSDWLACYGDELQAIVTTVGGGKTGSLYLADNWELIGQTAGLPPDRSSVSMKWDRDDLAARFVKPTGEDRKLILGTRRLAAPAGVNV